MEALNALLDKIKESRSLKSDAALARELKVSAPTLCNWRKGGNLPDTLGCARIAELSGEPLAKVIGLVGEARAISPAEKAIWRRLSEAAAWAVGVALGTFLALSPTPGQAMPHGPQIMPPDYALCTLRH